MERGGGRERDGGEDMDRDGGRDRERGGGRDRERDRGEDGERDDGEEMQRGGGRDGERDGGRDGERESAASSFGRSQRPPSLGSLKSRFLKPSEDDDLGEGGLTPLLFVIIFSPSCPKPRRRLFSLRCSSSASSSSSSSEIPETRL